jgi:hypothetical protein
MNPNFIAFILGLFGVPLALLAIGHRLRRRSPRMRAIFWGAIVGHCVAAVLAVVWGMIPPDAWEPSETARGFAGLWSLLVFPVAGALLFALGKRGGSRASIALFATTIACATSGSSVSQQPTPTLQGVVGPWTAVVDGGAALKVDGETWNAAEAGPFPIAVWNGTSSFTDGTLRVRFKMVGGKSDQNGGIVFGLQPSGDYYFVRYNTKDGNVAVWQFATGARTVLAHGEAHKQLPMNEWQELAVVVSQGGRKVTGSVTGQGLAVEYMLPAPTSGRVGVWTKRDAITVFRDFSATR